MLEYLKIEIEGMPIYFILVVYMGSICAHMLSLNAEGFKGTIPFLKRFFPNKSETLYFRIDSIVLPIIGTALACILLEPGSLKASLFAGMSWSGALIALLKKNNKTDENDVTS